MGVSELWSLLRSEGMVREWNCETDGQKAQKVVAEKLEGKVVAVDISLWTCQALTQGALKEVFESDEQRVVKVAFDRIINYLRFGCTPVGVLDGEAPDEKLETLQARFFSRFGAVGGGGGNSYFVSLCSLMAQLFRAMGLWVVQAPGEAEAMCAALNRAGHVDACVTKDSDALLFGAQTLFQTIKPVTNTPNECKLLSVRMDDVRACLGIQEGGELALTAIALLTGGDYHLGGADRVGQKQGLAVVKHLLRGKQSDADVLEDLESLLAQSPEEHADVLSHDKCTGCKRCKHEGHRKTAIKNHSSRNPCECCPPSHDGTCREIARSSCGCAFHRLEPLRVVYKAIQKARESPGFAAKAAAAQAAYQEQMEDAAAAVEEFVEEHGLYDSQRLTWQHRPKVPQVARLVERCGLPWDEQKTRGKMMALLMEWDASHPSTQAEFVPTELLKVHGSQEDRCWRYLMSWKRTPVGEPEDVEMDEERLQEKGKSVEFRCLRFATVRDCWPALLRAYEQKKADAAEKAAKKEARKAAKEGRLAPQQAAAQSRELAGMAARMQAFLQPQLKQPSLAKAADKTDAGLRSGTGDRGLGDLRPSASQRERRSHDRGAREGVEAESDEHRGGKGRDDAGAALARKLGVHSSFSDDSDRMAAVSKGEQWAAVLADDGISTPRGDGVGSGAGQPSPAALPSPGKRNRLAAAEVHDAVQSSLQTPREPAVEEVSLVESPEKRQKTPRIPATGAAGPRPGAAAAGARHPVDDVAVAEQRSTARAQPAGPGSRAAAQEGAVPCGQPSAADFSIRQRPAQPGGSRGGRGRRAASDAGTLQIERFLLRTPALCKTGASEGAPRQAGEHEGVPQIAAKPEEEGTPLHSSAANASSPGSIVDLTKSASPQHDIPTGSLTLPASSARGTTVTLRSPGERCSVERALEELLQSRGARPRPSAAEPNPQAPRGRALDFATPSTGGDIVVDLATPPSSQPVLDTC
ncbi:probable flap endonuclease GEN-like 1 at N-terminal half [Coccomyxa sp. Obi]|nr:probable flap endonuclease GEN-like 1 at N-terminal half [Coccomyxa sp. Obi]